jgi:RNA polymerase sigma factor (sigma-70 family)
VALTTAGSGPSKLGDWFRDWQLPLRRFLARRRPACAADIDDIAQEVFLRLLRYDRSELIDYPQAYLFKIASNVSAEWAMRSSRRLPHHSEWLTELVDALTPEVELERQGLDEQLHAAIEALPARSRQILRLHFADGITHEEIARRLGVTRKIVKRDMARAYASLRVSLDLRLIDAPRPQTESTP